MMRLERFILTGLMMICALATRAQYDPVYSHYFDMEPTFNPASVGKQETLNVTAAYALSFAGFENNPRTFQVAGDMPFLFLNQRHGAGLGLQSDQIGLFTHQKLTLQYAFRKKMLGGTVSLGVQGGVISEKFEGSKVELGESGDPAIATTDVNGSGFDLGFGLYYQRRSWYAGLSAQHLTSPTIQMGETSELKIDPVYYFTAGYNIRLRNPFLTIKPSLLVRYDGTTWRGDLTGRLVYQYEKKMLYGGVTYSPDRSATLLLGGSFHGVVLGYSYEAYTSRLNIGNGSHELFVGYQTDLHLGKKGRNRHQSVRIL